MYSLQACRSCLAYNVKMFYMDDFYVKTFYEPIMGEKMNKLQRMSFPLCFECEALFRKTTKFRDRSKKVSNLLRQIIEDNVTITKSHIDNLRYEHNLFSQLSINCNKTPIIYVDKDEPIVKVEIVCDYSDIKDETISLPDNKDLENESELFETNKYRTVISPSHTSREFNIDSNHRFYDDVMSNQDEMVCESLDYDTLPKPEDLKNKIKKKLKKKKHEKKSEKVKRQNHKVKVLRKTKKKSLRRTFFFKPDYVTEIFLTREQQLAEIKEKEASSNYVGSPMRCDRCYKGFLKEDAFKNHMSKHSESAGAYECDLCGFRYRNKIRLTTHVNGHIRRFSCKRCDYISQTPAKARSHENWHKGVTYECHVCQKQFNRETTRSNHVRKEHPTVFCHICGNSFVGENGLDLHRKLAHARIDDSCQKGGVGSIAADMTDDSSRENYCVACDIPFTSAIALTNHIVKSNEHANDAVFVCKICTITFSSRRLLYRHVREHMNEECLTTDNKQDGQMAESDGKRWKCNNCATEFSSAVSLDNHRKKMRQGECNVKDFVCEWCGKRFQAKAVLQCHIRIHTGEKPFECTKCPKRFNTRAILLRHLRMHTGERPFSCDICNTRFKEKSALARHAMVHSGVKPHYCVLCSKAYTCKWWLKQHLNSAHGKAHTTIQ